MLERDGTTILSYGAGGGYGPLRELLAERHGVEPHACSSPRAGCRGSSSSCAAQLQRRPGRVLVEGPTYDRPLKLLGWQGAEVVSLPMDEEGLDLDALEAELDRGGDISFLYTIPTFQNPSGRTLGVDRRRRLAAIVAERGLDVLEDDPYGLVRYEGEAPPSLHELEGGEPRQLHLVLLEDGGPGPAGRLRRRARRAARGVRRPRGVDVHLAAAAPAGDRRTSSTRRVRSSRTSTRIRGLLRARRDAMLGALEREMPADVSWNRPEGGYFLWVDFGAP